MPPKRPQSQWHLYEDRLASFLPITKPKSRARHGWPLTPDHYPLLTPENMALAGFYFEPVGNGAASDTCVCFLCGVRLGGWDSQDDPCQEHVRRGDCAWADTVCQVELDARMNGYVSSLSACSLHVPTLAIMIMMMRTMMMLKLSSATYANQEALPSSSTSSKVRENTFYPKGRAVEWWPHPSDGFTPTPTTVSVPRHGHRMSIKHDTATPRSPDPPIYRRNSADFVVGRSWFHILPDQ